MNILFFLTPKSMCAYLEDKSTLRQALERMEVAGYAALPILNEKGEYCGTLTEGDMLWAVSVTTSMQDLINRASEQNFVPVIDDKNTFIGLVTRRAIMRYCQQTMAMED